MDNRGAAGQLQRGLLIEVDLTVLSGMGLCFEAYRARLARENVKLDIDLFRRFLFGKHVTKGMIALLAKVGHPVDDPAALAGECATAYLAALRAAAEKALAGRDGVLSLARDAAGRDVKVGLLTQLPEDVARQVFAGLLGDRIVVVAEAPSTVCLHGWEGWRRASRKLGIRERLCVAISSPGSSRGALAAAMRLLVVMDPLQAHVDCSGADTIVETVNAAASATVLDLLRTA